MGSQFFSKLSLMQWTHPSSLTATKCKLCQYTGRLWHLYSVQQERTKNTRNCCTHYWKMKENSNINAELAHWTVIYWPVTKHFGGGGCHQFYSKHNSGAYFLSWQLLKPCQDNCFMVLCDFVMKQNGGSFLPSCTLFSFSRGTLLHGERKKVSTYMLFYFMIGS
jgi:hypothetical protein